MRKALLAPVMGAVVLGLGSAPAGAAGRTVQGVPGASCSVDKRSTAEWEYRGQRLLNTESDPWAIVVATCPVSLFAPGQQPLEYRISLRDPQRRETWCKVYSHDGTLVRTTWLNEGSSGQIMGSLAYPLGWTSAGLVEATFHCLLQSGASLDRIEIHWWQP